MLPLKEKAPLAARQIQQTNEVYFMLQQNIIQVYENQRSQITIAKGEFKGVSERVEIESISISASEARQVIKALKDVLSDMELI